MDVYVTKAQLIKLFGEDELIQRTDRTPFTGAINDAVLAEAVTAAENHINGYLLAASYVLPLTVEVVDKNSLAQKCADVARYFLYDDALTEVVEKRFNAVQKWLNDVQAKKVLLVGIEDNTAAPIGNVIVKQGVSRLDWSSY